MRLSHIALAFTAAGVLASAALPVTPRQSDPWSAPATEIPDHVVKGVAALFDAGLADPRGGAYREFEITHFRQTFITHGWTFDGEFAVAWNGLVYRIQKTGALADLEQDVRAIAAAASPGASSPAFWTRLRFGTQNLGSLSVALLLRLGRVELAEELWRSDAAMESTFVDRASADPNWLTSAAIGWMGAAFRRFVDERIAGHDETAVEIGESLTLWEQKFREGWERRHSTPLTYITLASERFSFLSRVPTLLADEQRRLRAPKKAVRNFPLMLRSGDAGGEGSPDFQKLSQPERIAELIDRLEDVVADKMTIPGSLMLMWAPVCQLLVKEGEAAVGPLLDAYEKDQRLTRTLDFGRPWYLDGRPVPVTEVVKAVLTDILQVPEVVGTLSPARLRVWWEKRRASDPVDRSFKILLDDDSTALEWVESAEVITLRSDVVRSGRGWTIPAAGCKPGENAPAPTGEVLRSREHPSVIELLAKRTAALASSHQQEFACRIAFSAYLWDTKASLPVLRAVSGLDECQRNSLVAAARLDLGDSAAGPQWATGIEQRAARFGFDRKELAPLWLFPQNPDFQGVGERLFFVENAPLSPRQQRAMHSPAYLLIPAFRRAVLRELQNATVEGSVTVADGQFNTRFSNGGGGGPLDPTPGDLRPQPGEAVPLRVKDLVVMSLASIQGFPKFRPYWPESVKDEDITRLSEFLVQRQNDLRVFPGTPRDSACFAESVYFVP